VPRSFAGVDWSGMLTNAFDMVVTFVPRLLFFALILVVGFVLAKALMKVTDKVLERVGFDRAVERGGVARAMAKSRYDASDIAAKIVYYAVVLLTLQVAFSIFGPNAVTDLLNQIVLWLPSAFAALVIVVVAAFIAKGVKDLVTNALSGLSYGTVLGNAAAGAILFFGVTAALTEMGVAVVVTSTVFIAVLATIGGILVVGVGGGLVAPMARRWEGWLDRAATEAGTAKASVQASAQGSAQSRWRASYDDETVDLRTTATGARSTGTSRDDTAYR
jgi:hypothetical protein